MIALALDAAGSLAFSFAWPSGLSGLTSLWQAWFPDGALPPGFRASNALEATAP